MRFNLNDPKMKTASFSHGRSRDLFIILAASEIALMVLMVLLFIKLKAMVDAPILISAILIVIGVFTYFARTSSTLAQSMLIFCVLASEIILFIDLQQTPWTFSDLKVNANDVVPVVFVAFDIVMVAWVLSHGIHIGEEEKVEDARKVREIDFEERSRR